MIEKFAISLRLCDRVGSSLVPHAQIGYECQGAAAWRSIKIARLRRAMVVGDRIREARTSEES